MIKENENLEKETLQIGKFAFFTGEEILTYPR
jgi:hypothetical protein